MKRFILKSLLYGLPIFIPLAIFVCFINPKLSGDIGPLGYITFPNGYSDTIFSENKVQNCGYDFSNYSADGILTIGDSFSKASLEDISYNYYLAEFWDNNVYNLPINWWTTPFNRFIYLSKTQDIPKIIIIESVERHLIERLNEITLNLTPEEMIRKGIIDTTNNESHSEKKSILEKTQEWMKRNMNIKGYDNPIYHAKLSQPLFSCQGKENDLYFYCDDISNANPHDTLINSAIKKLDSLFNYASTIDVELYILIAADKYDVYQDYIINNEHPKQKMLDIIAERYNHPNLINSKDTLSNMVENGIRDVYWSNNTHWSPIGSKAVALQVLNRLK